MNEVLMLVFKLKKILFNKRINPKLICIIGLFSFFILAFGEKFYVAPYGDDNNPGTISKPFATIKKAKDVVWMELDGSGDITVYFRGGTYFVNQPIVFRVKDSGSENQIVTYRNFPGENPIFTSGVKIKGWRLINASDPGYRDIPALARKYIYICDVSDKLRSSGIFKFLLDQNSDWLPRSKTKSFTVSKKRRIDWKNPDINDRTINELERVFYYQKFAPVEYWTNIDDIEISIITKSGAMYTFPVDYIDYDSLKIYAIVPEACRIEGFSENLFANAWIENSLNGLDERGEWVLDSRVGKLYLWPLIDTSKIYTPTQRELIRVEGNIDYWGIRDIPVRYINFKGITFTNGDYDSWSDIDYSIEQNWEKEDKATALMRFRGAEHCMVDSCSFVKSGGTGVRFDLFCQFNTIQACHFENLGKSGVLLCGYGPGKKDVNINNRIIQNEIERIGRIKWNSQGIIIWQSGYNYVAYNYIHDLPYQAIGLSAPNSSLFNPYYKSETQLNPSMRWSEIEENVYLRGRKNYESTAKYRYLNGNIIEFNTIHNVLDKLKNGGAIYISGTGTGDYFGSPNVFQLNYIYDINGGNSIVYIDEDACCINIKKNILYDSQVQNGIYADGDDVFCESNIFLSLKPEKFSLYGTGKNNFWGNLLFDNKVEPIRYGYWLEDYVEILNSLEQNKFPGRLLGSDRVRSNLRWVLNAFR
jgi:hypothetical protein